MRPYPIPTTSAGLRPVTGVNDRDRVNKTVVVSVEVFVFAARREPLLSERCDQATWYVIPWAVARALPEHKETGEHLSSLISANRRDFVS